MSGPVDIAVIVAGLNARIREVCERLGLRGQVQGHDFVAFNPMRADRHLGSFRICVTGAKAGVWKEFSSGEAGDGLDLVAYCLGGGKAEAVAWGKAFLGLDGADPAALKRTRRAVAARAEADPEAEAEKRRRDAFAIWLAAQEKILGTPAEGYLAGRAIELRRLGRQPRALRFHPRLWNAESRRHWPALVAAITGPDGKALAIHRTWLEVAGGRVRKAPLKDAKMTLGGYRGGLIRLWRGQRVDAATGEIRPGRRWRDIAAGAELDLSEGIEDGLSVAAIHPECRVAAFVSVGNLARVALPPAVATVALWVQNDAPGSDADKQVARGVERLLAEGRRVRLVRVPAPHKDVNELLQALRRDEERGVVA